MSGAQHGTQQRPARAASHVPHGAAPNGPRSLPGNSGWASGGVPLSLHLPLARLHCALRARGSAFTAHFDRHSFANILMLPTQALAPASSRIGHGFSAHFWLAGTLCAIRRGASLTFARYAIRNRRTSCSAEKSGKYVRLVRLMRCSTDQKNI